MVFNRNIHYFAKYIATTSISLYFEVHDLIMKHKAVCAQVRENDFKEGGGLFGVLITNILEKQHNLSSLSVL